MCPASREGRTKQYRHHLRQGQAGAEGGDDAADGARRVVARVRLLVAREQRLQLLRGLKAQGSGFNTGIGAPTSWFPANSSRAHGSVQGSGFRV